VHVVVERFITEATPFREELMHPDVCGAMALKRFWVYPINYTTATSIGVLRSTTEIQFPGAAAPAGAGPPRTKTSPRPLPTTPIISHIQSLSLAVFQELVPPARSRSQSLPHPRHPSAIVAGIAGDD
jgi:hypothetical protein